uniref:Uncharacterized protein n=1 Tax=Paramoeba aestuarina TaxID=180227 RepID=A0A7S4KG14_9EUKA|mmetsp:Transcript_18613/g.29173  ORF Transcript_18613/g.29173 Transcript_18613/m.29173 type:complete len:214 (+) Transcript_18613:99-740(+)
MWWCKIHQSVLLDLLDTQIPSFPSFPSFLVLFLFSFPVSFLPFFFVPFPGFLGFSSLVALVSSFWFLVSFLVSSFWFPGFLPSFFLVLMECPSFKRVASSQEEDEQVRRDPLTNVQDKVQAQRVTDCDALITILLFVLWAPFACLFHEVESLATGAALGVFLSIARRVTTHSSNGNDEINDCESMRLKGLVVVTCILFVLAWVKRNNYHISFR